jgi:hypothetical protein
LTVSDRQDADDLIGREVVNFERVEQPPSFRPHRPPVDPACPRQRRMPEKDVLGDAELGKQQQLLIDRRNTRAPRVVRRGKIDLRSVHENGANVRLVDAGHDLDEG